MESARETLMKCVGICAGAFLVVSLSHRCCLYLSLYTWTFLKCFCLPVLQRVLWLLLRNLNFFESTAASYSKGGSLVSVYVIARHQRGKNFFRGFLSSQLLASWRQLLAYSKAWQPPTKQRHQKILVISIKNAELVGFSIGTTSGIFCLLLAYSWVHL